MKSPSTKEKIILHLSRFPHSRYYGIPVPYEVTQEGIGEAVGTSRNYISVVLGRMERQDSDIIFSELRRVRGHKKRKVYFLTQRGFEVAESIISRYKEEKVRVILDEKEVISIPLSEISNYIEGNDPQITALLKMDGFGNIHLRGHLPEGDSGILVGRAEFLKRFKEILWKVKGERALRCVTIRGTTGIGKTTLAIKMVNHASREGFVALLGRCYANMDFPYFPILSMFRSSPDLLRGHKRILRELQRKESIAYDRDVMETKRNELWYKIAEEIRREARKRPLLFFIDDIQWADESTLALISHLCRSLEDSPIIFLFTLLDEGGDAKIQNLDGIRVMEEFELDPLDREETRELLSSILGEEVSEDVAGEMWEITDGNPLFIVEAARRMEKDANTGEISLENMPIPSRLEALVLSRLLNLKSEEAEVLRVASVMGQMVPKDLLSRIVKVRNLDTILNGLVDKGFLTGPVAGAYTFTHPMIQRILYAHTSNRAEIHRRITVVAEEIRSGGKKIGESVNLGFHYERCGEIEKAVDYYIEGSECARKRYAYEDSIRMLERALELAEKGNMKKRKREILSKLAYLYMLRGMFEISVERYTELLKIVTGEEKAEIYLKIAQVQRQMGAFREEMMSIEMGLSLSPEISLTRLKLLSEKMWISLKSGDTEGAKRILDDMETIASMMKNDEASAVYMDNVATLHHYMGNVSGAMDALRKVIEIRERKGDIMGLSRLYTNMGILRAQSGNLRDAISYFLKSKEIDEKVGNLRGLSQTYMNVGVAYHKLGELQEALDYMSKARDTYRRIGSRDSLGIANINIGNVLMDMGQFERAEKSISAGVNLFGETGDMWGMCHGYRTMGDIKIYLKRYPEALCWIGKAINLAKETKNTGCLVESYLDLARIYAKTNEIHLAEAILDKLESEEIFEGDPYLQGEKLLVKGIIESRKGNHVEAAEAFGRAQEIFEKMGEVIPASISLCMAGREFIAMGNDKVGEGKKSMALEEFRMRGIEYWAEFCGREENIASG